MKIKQCSNKIKDSLLNAKAWLAVGAAYLPTAAMAATQSQGNCKVRDEGIQGNSADLGTIGSQLCSDISTWGPAFEIGSWVSGSAFMMKGFHNLYQGSQNPQPQPGKHMKTFMPMLAGGGLLGIGTLSYYAFNSLVGQGAQNESSRLGSSGDQMSY